MSSELNTDIKTKRPFDSYNSPYIFLAMRSLVAVAVRNLWDARGLWRRDSAAHPITEVSYGIISLS